MAAGTAAGLGLGLGAAIGASIAYLFGRRFMTRRGGAGPVRLLVEAHLVMALLALACLPLLPVSGWPAWSRLAPPVGVTVGCYLLGQTALFATLRGIEPSRAAPLLGAKIVALALILALGFGRSPRPGQWLGVLAAAVGVYVLGGAGVRLSRRQVVGVLGACLCYAGSDLGAKAAVDALAVGGMAALPAALTVTALVHLAAGVPALALLPLAGRGDRRDWAAAGGYACFWFGSLVCLFGAFALLGVVPGAILQSFRGIVSVLLGVVLARAGWHGLEARAGRRTVLGRLLGAGLMVAAVAAWVGCGGSAPDTGTTGAADDPGGHGAAGPVSGALDGRAPEMMNDQQISQRNRGRHEAYQMHLDQRTQEDFMTTDATAGDDPVTPTGTFAPDGEAQAFCYRSTIMEGSRPFWVALPPSLRAGRAEDRRFPVVVHLDGHSHGRWSPVVADYMMRRGRIPEVILVGVALMAPDHGLTSVERARDLTPTHSLGHYDGTENECYRKSGGADRFLAFLEGELLPHIDARYPTLPRRVVVGQSLSGCFVFDRFLTGRSRFQAFLAMDPCLWWDDWRATRLRDALPPGSPIFERGLFLAFSGTDEAGRRMQVDWFGALVARAAPDMKRRLRFAHYGEDSHISMNLPGFYEGLRFLFSDSCGLDWQ